ncbi:MAG: hypothetical protein LUG88_00855 [Clostridia bacterium]|nr:hypothetical protein [Clostridia bacterium]
MMRLGDDVKKYADIMYLPHKQSAWRPKMSNRDRAAQFSPFAALSGFDDAVKASDEDKTEAAVSDESDFEGA